jgi:glycerate 2-kinase
VKIVIAPDSFKGSISAQDLCDSIATGIYNVIPAAKITQIPLADGGEGTMENMVHATSGDVIKVNVQNPIGKTIPATYGILGDKVTAVIEMAQASGLPLLSEKERNPLITSSYGTGQLIRDALDKGFRRFIIGLGGSATNDGGMGMLRALGMQFYDQTNTPIAEGGGSLSGLKTIDDSNFDPRIKESVFLVASDVVNPLCGNDGASAVFGPQKGATEEMVQMLDQNLNHFADVIEKDTGLEIRSLSGGGAAGGMGAALITFMNAELKSGIELVMKEVRFEEKVEGIDLIITGEGKLDQQTLSGKVIMGVNKIARMKNVPVVALCGQLDLDQESIQELGILSAFSIIKEPCTLEKAFLNTGPWTTNLVEEIIKTILYFRRQ